MRKKSRKILSCLGLILLWPVVLYGMEGGQPGQEQALEEMVVEAERPVARQEKITVKSEGLPTGVTVITREDLKRMPVTSYLDIFRRQPGVYVSKYTGGDFGDRIGLRGFSSGHGMQVAFMVDGVPMNVLDYAHGTSEIAWLVPEMIERVEIIKGPFSALYGDFALGGVVNIITKKTDPGPSLGLYGGTYATGRAVGVYSGPAWHTGALELTPFLVWEGYTRQGYRDNNYYERGQFFNKITVPVLGGDLSLRAHYAARTWGDPGYLRLDLIKAGIIRRTAAVNTTDRGDSELADIVINYSPKDGESGFYGSWYYVYHIHNTGRTFPPNPQSRRDTFEYYTGYKMFYNWQPADYFSLVVGNDLRYDRVSVNQWNTLNYYTYLNQTRFQKFHYFSTGVFAQVQYKPVKFLKLVGGCRFDQFQIDIDNKLFPRNSGNASPNLWSPKVGLVLTPWPDFNIFANRGRGFRSPGPLELSPSSATQRANFSLGLAKLETWDVGFNTWLWQRIYLAFDYFDTRYTSEQFLNPATATYENLGTSKRTGVEVEARIILTDWLTVYGGWTHVRARLKNPTTPGAVYITGVPEDQAVMGLELVKSWQEGSQQTSLDFYYRLVGRSPANTLGTLIGSQFDQYLARLTHRYQNWTASVDAVFTPRRYASDIYTTSAGQLAITPWPKWEILGGLKYHF